MTTDAPLLAVQDLGVDFPTDDGTLHAVDGVTFQVRDHEVLGMVGESGSGKTVTALAVLGLLPKRAHVRGSVRLRGDGTRRRRDGAPRSPPPPARRPAAQG